jgi:hypothetical protein
MRTTDFISLKSLASYTGLLALALLVLVYPAKVRADESDAKNLLKAMSVYMAEQKAISFGFDATLEVVTDNDQRLALASSGKVTLNRPDKFHAERSGGFFDLEMFFNGKTLTLLGKNMNIYTQVEEPGTIDHVIDKLREKYNRPLPASDLLLSNSYEAMMLDVVDIKDLGSGVIGGVECDYLAFRTDEVDWQIWIAQGNAPYPYRYVITSRLIKGGPQYTVQTRNWKTGNDVTAIDFSFSNQTNAKKADLKDLESTAGLPNHFKQGGTK